MIDSAVQALLDARVGEQLALTWALCKRQWGAESVPPPVVSAYREAYEALHVHERKIVAVELQRLQNFTK